MARVYNFSAGPAVLPEEVLREAADEMLDYRGCGMSVMEMSHRSKPFAAIMEAAEQDIRDLMDIPDNYRVLFLQGGASTQFAMIPMNLMKNCPTRTENRWWPTCRRASCPSPWTCRSTASSTAAFRRTWARPA